MAASLIIRFGAVVLVYAPFASVLVIEPAASVAEQRTYDAATYVYDDAWHDARPAVGHRGVVGGGVPGRSHRAGFDRCC